MKLDDVMIEKIHLQPFNFTTDYDLSLCEAATAQ